MTARDDLWRMHAQADPGQAIHPQRLDQPARPTGHRYSPRQTRREGAGYDAGYTDGARLDPDLGGLRRHGPPAAGGGGGRSGCRGRLWLVLLLWPLLLVLTLCRHRSGPQPGDPGWSHPHVRGSTDPAEIARILREAEEAERQAQERIRAEQAERHRLAAEQQRRSR